MNIKNDVIKGDHKHYLLGLLRSCLPIINYYYPQIIFIINQVFNENRVIVMLKSAEGGWTGVRASTFGFRSITLVCFGLLTPNLLYG